MADKTVLAVHTVGRRLLPIEHPKLTQHIVDFKAASSGPRQAFSTLPSVEKAFVALGTTIKVAGSREAFRAVDFDAVLAVARAAKAAGATRLGVVSAMGADARSRVFYNRVKGEMEQALSALGFDTLVIARPSLLAGDRESLGQRPRAGERVGLALSRWLGPLLPASYKPIEASAVARALLRAVPAVHGVRILASGEMQPAALAATPA